MSYNDFTDAEIEVGKAIKKSLWTKLKDNFTSHESRVTALEGGGSAKLVLFNTIIDVSHPRVGEVKFSLIKQATDFYNLYGPNYDTIRGQSLSGKDLASYYGATAPNFRGRFPRIEGHGPVVGTTEANQNKAHRHTYNEAYDLTYSSTVGGHTSNGAGGYTLDVATGNNTGYDGSTESRPDSGVISAFVNEEDYDLTRISLFKAPYDFNIISAIVTNIDAGTSGTLEMDVLSGSSLGSVTSIFSTKPSVTSAAGDNASSTNAVISNPSVFENNWVRMDCTSLQTQQIRHHFYLLAELA